MSATRTANEDPRVGPTTPDACQRMLLQAFICFAAVALAVAIAMFAAPTFRERLLPYYGWPVIGLFYASALKSAIAPLLRSNPIPIYFYFRSIVGKLGCLAGFGAFMTLLGFYGDDYGNPYLTVTPWQPIWTIAVPLGWISVFCFVRRSRAASE